MPRDPIPEACRLVAAAEPTGSSGFMIDHRASETRGDAIPPHESAERTIQGVLKGALRQKQPQTDRHGHLVARQGERDQRLAVGLLPNSPQYCAATPADCVPFSARR